MHGRQGLYSSFPKTFALILRPCHYTKLSKLNHLMNDFGCRSRGPLPKQVTQSTVIAVNNPALFD